MKYPKDFKIGEVYKMKVGSHSHVKHPYFVEIIDVDEKSITTNIPGEHSLNIELGKNWEYHIPRMEFVGTISSHPHLLLNQKLNY